MRIAFIGLGAMGLPMAIRLIQAGHAVTGFDLNTRNRAAFEAAGGQWSPDAKGAVQEAELVWLMVVSGDQAHDFLFTQNHAADMPANAMVVMSCTQSASKAASTGEALTARGLRVLDAPVSGGVVGAEAGTLAIMVGGAQTDFDFARSALESVGSNLFHMGVMCGMGSTMKTVNQLLCGVHIAVAAEATHVAENAGLDLAQVHRILSVSAASSWMLGNRGPRMLQDEPPVTSAVDIFVKDLSIVAEEARRAKSGLPLAAAALQIFLAASGQGHGLADDSQVIRAYRGLNRGDQK